MPTDDEAPTDSEDAFAEQLGLVLAKAFWSDIEIEGGWKVQTSDEDVPDWDVEIWMISDSGSER